MAKKEKGKVFLVGAGPGDPGLLTLRGAEILKSADAVVYDRLVNPALLRLAANAEKIFAGKGSGLKTESSGTHPEFLPQEKISRLLVKLAQHKKRVVRLKGGDPFVFGRGGEEATVLKKAGIPFEIVPGISAAYAVPAYAGIPITDRRFASSVTLMTAHENFLKDEKQNKWEEFAHLPGTLVFFMGVKTFPEITQSLLKAGKSPNTRVSVIEWGTLPQQRVVEGTLRTIAQKIKKAKIQPPALAVIGEVNRLRRQLNWFHPEKSTKPLSGKTVLLTRAGTQSGPFKQILESEGALVREFPVIQILPPKNWKPMDDAIREITGFDWIIFTSINAVDTFFERLHFRGKDSRVLSGIWIAAIGETTREKLLEKGIQPDFVPEKFTSEGLVTGLAKKNQIQGRAFLLPRTDIAPPYLVQELEKRGAKVTQVIAYRTVPACGPREKEILHRWLKNEEIDFITFTSASTVDNFFALLPKQKRGKMTAHSRLVSIGPVTTQTLRKYGAKPWREAKEHTMKGLLKVLINERH